MSLADRLRQLASLLPDGGSVSLPKTALLEMVESEGGQAVTVTTSPEPDLTVADIARETGRAESTARGWFEHGALKGHRFNGREWRATRADFEAFKKRPRKPSDSTPEPTPGRTPDLGAWRKLRKAG